jgi:hypothetical protein
MTVLSAHPLVVNNATILMSTPSGWIHQEKYGFTGGRNER